MKHLLIYGSVCLLFFACEVNVPDEKSNQLDPHAEIITIRPDSNIISSQGLPYFVGVSDQTAGSKGLSFNMVIVPPGGKAEAHTHKGFESAIYVLKGRARTEYGEGLTKSVIHQEGDFIYIPAGVPHRPVNLSDTEEVVALVCRTSASEDEAVETYEMKE